MQAHGGRRKRPRVQTRAANEQRERIYSAIAVVWLSSAKSSIVAMYVEKVRRNAREGHLALGAHDCAAFAP